MNKLLKSKFRVKIKSLAEEICIIRRELEKNPVQYSNNIKLRASIQQHLDVIVKPELRHTLIAYGFIKGLPYKAIEQSCRVKPKSKYIKRIIKSLSKEGDESLLSDSVDIQDIELWLNS